MKVFLLYCFL